METSQAEPSPTPTPSPPPRTEIDPNMMYDLLLGEVAGQRGDMELAYKKYAEAAFKTRDPAVIERALRIASFARADYSELRRLAKLWLEVSPNASEPRQVLAMLHVEGGEPEEAAAQLEEVFKVEPGFDYMRLAGLLSRQNNRESALKTMEYFLQSRQGEPKAVFAHAHLAMRFEDNQQALTLVDKTLALAPELPDAVNLRAHLLQRLNRETEAAEYLAAQLKGPMKKNPDVRLTYARLLLSLQRFEEAWDQLKTLADMKGVEDSNVRYLLGVTSMQINRLDEARAQFSRIVDGTSRSQDARFHLGRLDEFENRPDQAIEWYESVTEGTFYVPAQLQRAALLHRKGDSDRALALLDSVESEVPAEKLSVVLLKGEILFATAHYQESFDTYGQALAEYPGEPRLLYGRSLVAEKLDRLDVAERDLREILAKEPDNAAALNALGFTLVDRTDRVAEGAGYIERALAQRPDDPAIMDSMGWALYHQGKYAEAVEYLRKALKIMNDAEIAAHLGAALWRMGNEAEARAVWKKALEHQPGHEKVQQIMKQFGLE
ncbi:MAG: tetratricopeptide repeat protein [Pseudomonadota bacterium]